MVQLKLWKFSEDYGRCGDVGGLFIATEEEVDKFLDKRNICFGEVLGKHSDVDIYFEKGKNLKCLEVSQSTIQELFIALDSRTISGHNPFEYIYDWLNCSDCDSNNELIDCVIDALIEENEKDEIVEPDDDNCWVEYPTVEE